MITTVLDTQTIDDNTRNGMRVNITSDPIAVDSFISDDGTVVNGTGLTITKKLEETSIFEIQGRIDYLTTQIPVLQAELDGLNKQLPDIEAAVDDTISKAINNGAQDNRLTPLQQIQP
jgi:hypothetical protein